MKLKSLILIPTSITFFSMIAVAAFAFLGIKHTIEKDFNMVQMITKIERTILQAHTDAYCLIAWIANYDDEKIKSATKEIVDKIDQAHQQLTAPLKDGTILALHAVAESMEEQSQNLQRSVAVFKVQGSQHYGTHTNHTQKITHQKPNALTNRMSKTNKLTKALALPDGDDDNWEEF